MLTVAARQRLTVTLRLRTVLADPGNRLAIKASGFAAAVAAGLYLSTSSNLVHPVAYGLQDAVMVTGAVVAALVWLKRRPMSAIAPLLLALGLAYAIVAFQGSSDELLRSLGVAVEPVVFVLTCAVVFAFPDGKLNGRAEWCLLAGIVSYFLVKNVPWLFFSPFVVGSQPLARCNGTCPANGLMIADRPELADPVGSGMAWGVIVLATATVVVLIFRLVTASRPRRRALLPVYIPALMLMVPVGVYRGLAPVVGDFSPHAVRLMAWSETMGHSLLAWGFVVAVVQASFFAGSALKRLMGRIADNPDAADLRAIVSEALDDPSVELAFRVDGSESFVDSRGEPVAGVMARDGRATTPVARHGDTVAAIWHDPALNTDPELLRAASHATLLALENGRLASQLRTATTELAASRARAVAAGDLERRKVERDLHDGAQQRLTGLSIELALTRELAKEDPEVVARLDALGHDLENVLSELRDLAHGIYPPVLRDFGLQAAVAAAARRCIPPAALVADRIVRYPADIEAAVYFCCLEGLQNAGKHAGADAHTEVHLSGYHDELRFAVVDDGIGCDVESARCHGAGFENMRERVAVVRGTLMIDTAPGRGMQLRGRIPLGA